MFSATILSLIFAQAASAKSTISTTTDRVFIYSGPGLSYRPLSTLQPGVEYLCEFKPVKSADGHYYRIALNLQEKKYIGYVPLSEDVRLKSDEDAAEDFAKYSEVALSKKSLQAEAGINRDDSYYISIGHLTYRSPGFYSKYFLGSRITTKTSVPMLGFELGNDALVYKRISGFINYGVALAFITKDDDLFSGSKRYGANVQVKGNFGLRYNAANFAAISFGPSQMAILNANNSTITVGIMATVEVGL